MIQSFLVLLDDGAGQAPTVCDTVHDGKHVITGVGIGRVDNGHDQMTPTAARALTAACDYAHSQGLHTVRLVEVATTNAAPMRVRKALESASEKDVVFFLCRRPDVLDAVFACLNVQRNPAASHQ